MHSNKEKLEFLLNFDFGQKQQMSFLERIGMKKYTPKNDIEKQITDLEIENKILLEKFLVGKEKLDLFNQDPSQFRFKSGRPKA